MHAAVAVGPAMGGYTSIAEATRHMTRLSDLVYHPIPAHQPI
jgi:hypothetical protein